jgi:PPM family protein phosphatase
MKQRDEEDTLRVSSQLEMLNSTLPEPYSSHVEVDVTGQTHRGRVRESNEDNYLVARGGRSLQVLSSSLLEPLPISCEEIGYGMVVADGMGGAAGGEIASSTALVTLLDLVLTTPDWVLQTTEPMATEVVSRIHKRFFELDAAIAKRAEATPFLAGMGTTLTIAWSIGRDLFVGHVGDSRCYLFRKGSLHRLTKDQTLAQSMIDRGILKAGDNAARNFSHILTQAIGTSGESLRPEVHLSYLEDGDQILLCTDGLSDMVDDSIVAEILKQHDSSASCCDALVNAALEKGGLDNITVVLARYRLPSVKKHTFIGGGSQVPRADSFK